METSLNIDTLYIQALEKASNLHIQRELINPNEWFWHKVESINDYANENRITDELQRTLFHTNYSSYYAYKKDGKIIERAESLLFKLAGLKTHRRYIDRRRNKALNKIIRYLKSKNIDYGITELHLAFDIELDTAIDNFLPVKLTKGMNINDPNNYIGTKSKGQTLYLESNNAKNKAYLYNKNKKEKLKGKTIHRFEIKLSKLHDISRNPFELINYIEKQLNAYKLFYFQDIDLCNQFKEQYSKNIAKEDSPNVPDKLLRDIRAAAKEIELKLTDEIKTFIINTLSKKENSPALKIQDNQIVELLMYQFKKLAKKYVLQLKERINSLSIYPLILKAFPPPNKAPPIINQHLPLGLDHSYLLLILLTFFYELEMILQ